MATFDEFKKYATEKAEEFAGKANIFAKQAADKAKCLAKIAKLKADILSEKEIMKKNYVLLGKAYYETHKDEPADGLAKVCEDITASQGIIDAKEQEVEALKNSCGNASAYDADCEPADEEEAGCEEEKPKEEDTSCGCDAPKDEEEPKEEPKE